MISYTQLKNKEAKKCETNSERGAVGETVHPHLAVESLAVQPMLPFHFPVVAGRRHPDTAIADAAFFQKQLEAGLLCRIIRQKRLRPLRTIVCLHLPDGKRTAEDQLFHEIKGAGGAVFFIHFPETPAGTFVHSGILVVFVPIDNTRCGNILHVNLYLLSRIFYSRIRLGRVFLPFGGSGFQIHAFDCTKHTLVAPCIPFFPQFIPQPDLVVFEIRKMPADQLVLLRRVFIRMMVRAVRFWDKAFPCPIILLSPVVDDFPAYRCFGRWDQGSAAKNSAKRLTKRADWCTI